MERDGVDVIDDRNVKICYLERNAKRADMKSKRSKGEKTKDKHIRPVKLPARCSKRLEGEERGKS